MKAKSFQGSFFLVKKHCCWFQPQGRAARNLKTRRQVRKALRRARPRGERIPLSVWSSRSLITRALRLLLADSEGPPEAETVAIAGVEGRKAPAENLGGYDSAAHSVAPPPPPVALPGGLTPATKPLASRQETSESLRLDASFKPEQNGAEKKRNPIKLQISLRALGKRRCRDSQFLKMLWKH